jgi:hypothetical protein
VKELERINCNSGISEKEFEKISCLRKKNRKLENEVALK